MTRLVRWQVPDWDKHLLDVAEYLMGKFSKYLHLDEPVDKKTLGPVGKNSKNFGPAEKKNIKASINSAIKEHLPHIYSTYKSPKGRFNFCYRLG